MKKLILLSVLLVTVLSNLSAQGEPFTERTVVNTGLSRPWEIVYGPGDSLYVTEATGYLIKRINIANGNTTTLLNLTAAKASWTIPSAITAPQGGLMGMAFHPDLLSGDPVLRSLKPYVYIAYVYQKATNVNCANPGPTCVFSTRIARYEYRGNNLINEVIILDNMPGSSDHNSGRLTISPVVEPGSDAAHTQYRLYYTIGDMGAGQFANTGRAENAQVIDNLEGKVLRLNTEDDGDGGLDAWVPNDNPYYTVGAVTARDYVFSIGHRNPQGLVWGRVAGINRLYSSEQSDRADDEINIIAGGNNYGWDRVSGFCDGDVNGFLIGQTTVVNEMTNCAGTTQPVFTTFHSNATWPSSYPANGSGNANWPTIASSSIEFYGKNVIPGWPGSILVTPLKESRVYRMKLNATGTGVTGSAIPYFVGEGNRNRRIISDPSGLRFYVMRDNAPFIQEYTYTGVTLPVRLLYFKAALQDNVAQLSWSTSSETNSSHYEIERSLDGVSFTNIGNVQATGNSSVDYTYTYSDINAVTQQGNTIYYRLRMVDMDGSSKYSDVVTISLSEKADRISVSPNPTSNFANVVISVVKSGNANWKVTDNSGLVVMQNTLQLKPGANTLPLDLSKLAAGIYYLNVSGTGINQKVKLQKL